MGFAWTVTGNFTGLAMGLAMLMVIRDLIGFFMDLNGSRHDVVTGTMDFHGIEWTSTTGFKMGLAM